jgi:hypothetical protein
VPGPESRPAADEDVEVVARATPRQVALGLVLGVALVIAGVSAGEQDWSWALATGAVAGLGGGAVVLLDGTPLQRGMDRVERVLPAQSVRPAPERGGWLLPAIVYGAIAVWFGLVREEYAFAGTMVLVGSIVYAAEGWQIHRWERRRGGRLGSVPRPSRRRRPFRTPEYVLLVDDPARADAIGGAPLRR